MRSTDRWARQQRTKSGAEQIFCNITLPAIAYQTFTGESSSYTRESETSLPPQFHFYGVSLDTEHCLTESNTKRAVAFSSLFGSFFLLVCCYRKRSRLPLLLLVLPVALGDHTKTSRPQRQQPGQEKRQQPGQQPCSVHPIRTNGPSEAGGSCGGRHPWGCRHAWASHGTPTERHWPWGKPGSAP
jgi:hypothetical protein